MLADELTSDPADRGYQPYIEAGDHSAVRRLLNEPVEDRVGANPIRSSELLIWAGAEGRLRKLKDGSESEDPGLSSICDAAVRMIQRDGTSLDLGREDVAGMLSALVSAGVLTSDDQASLEAMSTAKLSRAEIVIGHRAGIQDVRDALGGA